jgi:hypothetical protein
MERDGMSTLLDLLSNPLIQLFLIVGSVVCLSWVSEREEVRRVARGLSRRPLKARILAGLDLAVLHVVPQRKHEQEDIWVVAARELDLPLDKVLLLKARMQGKPKQVREVPKKEAVKQGEA